MEGDAGTSRLTPPEDDDAERSEEEESEDLVSADDDAERSEQEESDSETSTIDDAAESLTDPPEAAGDANPADLPAQRSRLYSRGWLVGACATLLVLTLLIAGGGVLALLGNQRADQRAAAEEAAVGAAKDCVIATQAPDVAAMSASQRKIVECATGDFGAQAALYSGVLVDAYQAANAQVQVSDIRAAPERHNHDGSIDVLVALRVKMSNSSVQGQETGYRLRVQMAPDNGTYKIARLDQVTK